MTRATADVLADRLIDGLRGAHPHQRRLELERFVDRFVDELLDDRLAPRPECVTAETAAELHDHGDPDPLQLARVAVRHDQARDANHCPGHKGSFPVRIRG